MGCLEPLPFSSNFKNTFLALAHILVLNGIREARPVPWKNRPYAVGRSCLQIPLMTLNFQYTHKLHLRGRKSRKIFSFDFVFRWSSFFRCSLPKAMSISRSEILRKKEK